MKLMIVEDNEMNLKLIKLIIKDLGYDTYFCNDGKEAIEQLANVTPDVILCDIQMPNVDGIGVLKYVRDHPELDNAKIIAITAHALVGDRERFIRMGFDNYISKPFDTGYFRELLEEYKSTIED